MKKRVVSGICTVLMLMALYALPALAATQDPSISGPGTVGKGDSITITVTTWAEALAGNVSVDGLEILGVSGSTLSTEKSVLIVTRVGGNSARYECLVTADPGETVSFRVSNAVESSSEEEYSVTLSPWTAKVKGTAAPETTPPPPPPTGEPTITPEPDPIISETPTESATDDGTAGGTTGGSGGTAGGGSAGGGSGNAATGGSEKLPKTADSNVDGWLVLLVGIASAGLALVAGRQVIAHRRHQ